MLSDNQNSAGTQPQFTTVAQNLRRGRILGKYVERLLLVSGFILLAVYVAARFERIIASRAALMQFDASTEDRHTDAENTTLLQETDSKRNPEWREADVSLWSEHRRRAYKKAVARMSSAPLAVLRISKIHLEVPVFDGTDDLTQNHAVGRIAGTTRRGEHGNIGIAGHRDGFFRGPRSQVHFSWYPGHRHQPRTAVRCRLVGLLPISDQDWRQQREVSLLADLAFDAEVDLGIAHGVHGPANNFKAMDISVPAAITVFPGEIYQATRSWPERQRGA